MARRGLGLFNLHGNIDNKKVMSCTLSPFGAYDALVEQMNTFDYKSFTLLGETMSIVTYEEKQQMKIYLHRFLEIAKYEFTKETRPPMRLRLWLKEERFEIVFDFDCPIIGWEEQEYIKELEAEAETLRAIIEMYDTSIKENNIYER
jgi:hypothetical protein